MPLRFNIICLLCLFWTQLSASDFDSLRMEQQGDQAYVIHRVEQGETLYGLSRKYGAKVTEIVASNDLVDNQIALFQEIRIPVGAELPASTPTVTGQHVVAPGETLYSLSKKYGLEVSVIKAQNQLASDILSVGQLLLIPAADSASTNPVVVKNDPVVEKNAIPAGFTEYYVQSGDLIETIAQRFKVRPDSIAYWNKLPNTYIKVGQKLLIKGQLDSLMQTQAPDVSVTEYSKVRKQNDVSGFTKILEEGIASRIEGTVETDKYLALHRTLKIGTLIEVRNLMNNQKIFVRVVGKLPETGVNQNVLLRMTPICFDRLGVIDPRSRVEISYYQE